MTKCEMVPDAEFDVFSILGLVDRCRRSSGRAISFLYNATFDFVYPPECALCGREIAEVKTVCGTCLLTLKPRFSNECPRCGAPVGQYADLTKGCGQCRKEDFDFDRVIRLGVYDGEMREACLRAKATGGAGVARALSSVLVQEKRSLFEQEQIDLVVPIPEHWTRRFLHSHYAAETISWQVSRQLRARWNRHLLKKVRRTPKQALSPTVLRRRQQQGSFGIGRNVTVSGQTILLIDDILTTGSTASAAARVLKKAGAKRVIVCVIAVSPLRK